MMKSKISQSLMMVILALFLVILQTVEVEANGETKIDIEVENNEYIINTETSSAILLSWRDTNPDIVVPDFVIYEGSEYRVTKVASYAFCATAIKHNIRSITLPEGLIEIQSSAFNGCDALEEIYLPFSLQYISGSVFSGCKSLKMLILPDRLTRLGDKVFEGCDGLETIYYPPSLATKMENAKLPEDIIEIQYTSGENGKVDITVVNVPEGVTDISITNRIGDRDVDSVTLPEGDEITIVCSHEYDCDAEKHFYECAICGEDVEGVHIFSNGNTACECGYVPFRVIVQPSGFDVPYGRTKEKSLFVIAKETFNGGTISYQWYENEKAIRGATTSTYVLPEKLAQGNYSYYCAISCEDYSMNSKIATVTVGECVHENLLGFNEEKHFYECRICGEKTEILHTFANGNTICECGYVPFEIKNQPSGFDVAYGKTKGKSLLVVAEGSLGGEVISYQWYEKDKMIEGAQDSSYNIPEKLEQGKYSYYCEVSCGNYAQKTETVTVTVGECEHAWNDGSITKQPTYSETGVKTFSCTICGETKTEEISKPAANSDESKDSDSQEQGSDVDSNPTVSHVKGRKYKDDKNKATYKVTNARTDGKGTVEYVKPVNKKKSAVTIPATVKIGGITYKVTSIAKNAFKDNKYIKRLTIEKNVEKIGTKAFYGCKKLKDITIKTSKLKTKKIGTAAFKKTPSNAKIKVPKKKLKAYKTMLWKKGVSKKAKIRKK